MTWREALYARRISNPEKVALILLGGAGVLLHHTVFYSLVWYTSSLRNNNITSLDCLKLYSWITVFSWVYLRIILSFRSPWTPLAVLPLCYYLFWLFSAVAEVISRYETWHGG